MIRPITITLHIYDHLDKAFRQLPANAIIHKGRCGIGGTTLEIKSERSSVIIVPTRGAIQINAVNTLNYSRLMGTFPLSRLRWSFPLPNPIKS